MKFKFDIKKVDIVNLNGVDLKENFEEQYEVSFEKVVGNLVFEQASDIDLTDKAREIHRGNEVEFTEREKGMFEECIQGKYIPFIERQILGQVIEIKE